MTAFKEGERSEYQDLSEGPDKTKDLKGWFSWYLGSQERKREKEGNEVLCLLKGRLKGSNSRSA